MKKVLLAIMLLTVMASMCACSLVPADSFLPRYKVSKLAKEYGTPQAEVTFNYEVSGKSVQVVVTYNLLLDQTPLAVSRFIQLANDGFYNDSLVDTYNSTNQYLIMGRYSYLESSVQDVKKYYKNSSDITFAGEFATNGYKKPAKGYAQFEPLSLAMFHETSSDGSTFNSANGALIMALTDQEHTLNYTNYAVFAQVDHLTIQRGQDGQISVYTDGKIPSDFIANLKSFTTKIPRTVYNDRTESSSVSQSIMATNVLLTVKILGDYDWSALPQIGK